MSYSKHSLNIFPEMADEDYQRLKSDMAQNGYDETQLIWLFHGEIIDGWNRQRAAKELDITPTYEEFEGSELDAINFVMRTNKRRNLSSSQWAAIAVDAEEIVATIEAAVEAEARRKQAETQSLTKGARVELIPPQPIGETKENTKSRTKIAETFNTNPRYISDAKRLKVENPEAFAKIKRGETTITQVNKEVKINARRADIEQQKKDIEQQNLPEINSEFDVLVFDPPWPYGREYDPETSRVANPYPEMSINQIKEIEVPAKDNSILFLWTTHQFLPDSFDILKEWGFTYKATMVWNKEKMGMGYWLRMQCEFCLLAVKGKPIWDITDLRDIFSEARREHSRKPDSFFDMVDRYFPYAARLEYFSREQREGWTVFGNDINKF